MPELTDPALELAELCDRLNVGTGEAGDVFLANTFSVEPWSGGFFQIVTSIVNRTIALEVITGAMKAQPTVKFEAIAHLQQIRRAFSKEGLTNSWQNVGRTFIAPEHSSPIRMLSPALPEQYTYPKLADTETTELQALVGRLLVWLRRLQLRERDFIRESLIEGLEQFEFRLQHLTWLGWGYTIQSLRDVILAYLTLERGLDAQANPDASAVLKRLNVLFRRVYKYASTGKEATETANWVIACYNVSVATTGPVLGFVAGLLAHHP